MAPKQIKSFGDLSGSDSEPDDEHNDYYVGGKASGQLVRGAPEDKGKGKGDKVANLFDKARKSGAVEGSHEDMEEPSAMFKGTGNTLAGGSTSRQAAPTNHVITFYRNGFFTVNNGPGRGVNDPANFKFIESISRGECPDELEEANPGQPVDVNLLKKDEDYEEPEKPKQTAFQGTGRTLAGPSTSAVAATAAASLSAASEGEWQGVEESKPTTSLQLRMADGSRMVARFNNSHRVSDVRRFIRASRPDIVGHYQLMTAFPSQLIQEEGRTLEEAGLLNAVLIVKNA